MGRAVEVGRAVTVAVSATSANLGPGFDCLGLALDWREQVDLTVLPSGFVIEVSGEGADRIPRDESHLIIRSALVGLADLGVCVPGLRLAGHNTIPHGRGLGSSSAAVVAGLVAATGLAGVELDRAWVLRHANAIEGHPDNVAAATYGGLVMAYESPNGVQAAAGRCTRRSVPPCSSMVGRWRRRGPASCCPNRYPTSTRPRTPAGPPCWCTRWPMIPTAWATPPGLAAPALPGAGHAAVVRPRHRAARCGFRRGDQRCRTLGPRARSPHPARRPGGVPGSGIGLRRCGIGPGATVVESDHYGNSGKGC